MNVKGMTIKDIMEIDPDDLLKMNRQQLASITNRLISASNKRIRRLEQTSLGRTSPAYVSASKRDNGIFSIRGKDLNQVRHVFARAKGFLSMKTSTLGGWREVREDVEERLGGGMTERQSKKFWKAYRELEERKGGFLDKTYKNRTNLTSDQIQSMLYQTFDERKWKGRRSNYVNLISKKFDEIYEDEELNRKKQLEIEETKGYETDDEVDY